MAQYIFKVNQKICSCKDCPFTIAVKDREYLNEDGSPVYHRGCVYLGVLVDLFYVSRHSECPFNELPPHGDLIDRDEIKLKHDPLYHLFTTAEMLKNEPTIVEASK